jgi:hypothetical protein
MSLETVFQPQGDLHFALTTGPVGSLPGGTYWKEATLTSLPEPLSGAWTDAALRLLYVLGRA